MQVNPPVVAPVRSFTTRVRVIFVYRTTGVGIGLVAVLMSACAGPVAVPVPVPSSDVAAAACAMLDTSLPSSVLTGVRRKTEPDVPTTAAWGDPPITLQCGVAEPATLTPTSTLLTVDGIDWYPEQRSAGYVFTTRGLVANVEVAVPDAYAPETAALTDLAPAITKSVPATPTQ